MYRRSQFGFGRGVAAAFLACASAVSLALAATGAAQAKQVWREVYNGTATGDDVPYASVINAQGDLIVAGRSQTDNHHKGITTLEYDPSGKQLWAHAETVHDSYGYDFSVTSVDVGVDAAGNSTVFGVRNGDYIATIATYSPGGKRLNRVEIHLPVSSPNVTGVQSYSNGDFSLTGSYFEEIGDEGDYRASWFVARYSKDGTLLWRDLYGIDGYDESPHVVGAAIDSSGNLVVGGDTGNYPQQLIFRTYDPSGNVVASGALDDTNSDVGDESASGFARDASGDIYISGSARAKSTNYGYYFLVAKFSPIGRLIWRGLYALRTNGVPDDEFAEAFTLDRDGNPIVGGEDLTTEGRLLVKWDSVGHLIWANQGSEVEGEDFLSPAAGSDEFYAIGGDFSGAYLSKFDADGTLRTSEVLSNGANYVSRDPASDDLYVLSDEALPTGQGYSAEAWVTLKYQLGH